jgi:hypothetical protein
MMTLPPYTISLLTVVGLLACVALAYQRRCPLLIRAVVVLAANFIVCKIAVIATGQEAPIPWLLFIDVASAFAMLFHPAARTQAVLGIVYIFQIALHTVHWGAGLQEHVIIYLSMLNVGGGLQIAFLILGAVNGDGRKVGGFGGDSGGLGQAVPHGMASVAGGQ